MCSLYFTTLTHAQLITSERHEKAVLGGTERLIAQVGKEHSDIYDKVVKIFQLYYQHDLVSEETFSKWGGKKASKKYVDAQISRKIHKAADPFLTWLAEAEEEEEEESDED